MFSPGTLFVIGAGAGNEVNMPVGWQLADQIYCMCRYETNSIGQIEPSDSIYFNALRRIIRDDGVFRGRCLPAVDAIRNGVRQVASIDNFIDTHPSDEYVRLVGKTAIARAILCREADSFVAVNEDLPDPELDFKKIEQSWYVPFGRILTAGIAIEDRETVFDNLTVVCFNYDRCLEQFLVYWLRAVYGIEVGEARDLVQRKFKLLRPYGSVGRLGSREDANCVTFGAKVDYMDLRARAEGIKTYTERSHDAETIECIQEAVAEAETIVFLGFAFHEPNMKLLAPTKPSQARRVFATADGLSEHEAELRRQQIADMLFCGKLLASQKRSVRTEYAPFLSSDNIVIRKDLKCRKFLDEYGASLRASSLVLVANHAMARQDARTAKH